MPVTSSPRKTGLSISFVSSIEEAVDPVAEVLNSAVAKSDLFHREYIIVPTAGVRAWLIPELAKRCGVSSLGDDGVLTNVKVGYVSLIDEFLGVDTGTSESPWSIPSMASVLLDILSEVDITRSGPLPAFCRRIIEGHGSPLSAALFMADRFDRYAAKRPDMIVAWDNGAPVMSPQADSRAIDDEVVPPALADQHLGQYELWRELRARIGAESPPPPVARQRVLASMKAGDVPTTLPARVTVVGLQSISLTHLTTLAAMASEAEVNVFLVHPSPGLAMKWGHETRTIVPTIGRLPLRPADPDVAPETDQLVGSWLRGSWEMQQVLASQGLTADLPVLDVAATRVARTPGLLGRFQSLVVEGGLAEARTWSADDQSLRIHRCHHLSRQIDVVHDALVHAFRDIPDLQPHEVVILCADIESAAPYLQAAFARKVTTTDGSKFEIPLVVDGRSMRKSSEVVDLLGQILVASTGRASVDDVMAVAGNPVVMKHFRVSIDDLELWDRLIDRTRVRWGFDVSHRARQGLTARITAHSWLTAVRSSLLGVMIPESETSDGASGIIPVADLEVADMASVSKLVAVIDVLAELERGTSKPGTIAECCDLLESALVALGGSRHADFGVALGVIGSLRDGVGSSRQPVEFAHFARVLEAEIDGESGRQALRTGAVTATSLVPLKGVPFKVICLLGFDDGSMSASEGDADDIVEAQKFVGDTDRRIEQRRTLFDALLAAGDRVVITCNGRSIKNNTPVPMVTALQELADLLCRLGVDVDDDGHSAVEVQHPLHVFSEPNFLPDALVDGVVWSTRLDARDVAVRVRDQSAASRAGVEGHEEDASTNDPVSSAPHKPIELTLEDLVRVWTNPLEVYLRDGLGIRKIRDEETVEALLPLAMSAPDFRSVGDKLLADLLSLSEDESDRYSFDTWKESVRSSGALPVGHYGERTFEDLKEVVRKVEERYRQEGFDLAANEEIDVDIEILDTQGRVVARVIDRVPGVSTVEGSSRVEVHGVDTRFKETYPSNHHRLAVRILALAYTDHHPCVGFSISRQDKESSDVIVKKVSFEKSADVAELRKRLQDLGNLYVQALAAPFGAFGATASLCAKGDRMGARAKFEGFCRSDKYVDTLECQVFGSNPRFDEVFVDKGAVVDFFTILYGLGSSKGKGKGTGTSEFVLTTENGEEN